MKPECNCWLNNAYIGASLLESPNFTLLTLPPSSISQFHPGIIEKKLPRNKLLKNSLSNLFRFRCDRTGSCVQMFVMCIFFICISLCFQSFWKIRINSLNNLIFWLWSSALKVSKRFCELDLGKPLCVLPFCLDVVEFVDFEFGVWLCDNRFVWLRNWNLRGNRWRILGLFYIRKGVNC